MFPKTHLEVTGDKTMLQTACTRTCEDVWCHSTTSTCQVTFNRLSITARGQHNKREQKKKIYGETMYSES